MYRYSAPQRGRYREHWQLSVEAIGTDDPAIDAEVIQLYDALLGTARRSRTSGSRSTRSAAASAAPRTSRASASGWTRTLSRLDEATREKAATSPLRVFDNIEAKPDARPRGARRGADDRGLALRRVPRALRRRSRAPRRVRRRATSSCRRSSAGSTTTRGRPGSSSGPDEGAQSTLSGGGRYDGLVEEIGGPPTPGVGFGAGIERLLLALEDAGVTADAARASTSSSCSTTVRRGSRSRAGSPSSAGSGVRRGHGLRGTVAEGAADPGRRGSGAQTTSIVGPETAMLRRAEAADETIPHAEIVGRLLG